MNKSNLNLFLEINNFDFTFFVGEVDEQNLFKSIYKANVPVTGIENNSFIDFENVFNLIKDNIYSIEQKYNHTFKEIILILENFDPKFVNLSGYKKLNGSQIVKENIIYIINILKSYVDKIEKNKTIIHIFNSKFKLDNKKIENLPIGLFGDFYSHELAFALINTNDYKNLNLIFENINLKVKKILLKSFIKGSYLSNKNIDTNTFFQIKINDKNSNLFYFENDTLKLEQNFNFGSDIILKDISKITSLKRQTITNFLKKIELLKDFSEDEIIEEKFFTSENYRKIKKDLIYKIASARIKEISELMIFKNINLNYYNKCPIPIFIELDQDSIDYNFKKMYKIIFSMNDKFDVKFTNSLTSEDLFKSAYQIVHFGWNKEAIPVSKAQKSLIARLFDAIFS